MLVGRMKKVSEEDVAAGNAAREAKWAASAALKSRQVETQEQDAGTKRMGAVTDAVNSGTARRAQLETSRSNIATEGLTKDKNKADAAYQTGSLENATRQTAIQGVEVAQKTPLIQAQTSLARAESEKSTAETGKAMSGLRMRTEYLNPSTTDETRQRIAGLHQAESGAMPRDTTHVLPGQKVTETDEKGRPREVVKPPVIVNEASGVFREAQPEAKVFSSPAEKLGSFIGTPRQKEAEEEYIRRYGSLPQGYTGGK